MAAPVSITAAKKQLRSLVRTSIKSLSPSDLSAQSSATALHLLQTPSFQTASSIALFISMPTGEICTRSLLTAALAANKTVYIPRVGVDFKNPSMDFIKLDVPSVDVIYDDWPRNKWSIPEPPETTELTVAYTDPEDTIDLIVLPGVAFDNVGGRLGQGKGYYDRYIAGLLAPRPTLIGIALTCQLQGDHELPMSADDVVLDGVASPDGVNMTRSP